MPVLSDNQKKIALLIAGLVETGLPMTPLAGTTLGFFLLGIAGLLSIALAWSLVSAHPGTTAAAPTFSWRTPAAKAVLLIPVILLIFMAMMWSYFGGLPALRSHADPTSTVLLENWFSTEGKPYWKEGEPVRMNVRIGNRGPEIAHDLRWITNLAFRLAPMSDALEEQAFNVLPKEITGLGNDLMIGDHRWDTVESQPLTKRDVTDLNDHRLFMYLVGQIVFRDSRGNHKIEYCLWLQPPVGNDSNGIWHSCHQHNRTL